MTVHRNIKAAASMSPRGNPVSGEAQTPAPYGNQPICPSCNRGATYSCICDDGPFAREDEQMPATDVVRIMGEFYPDSGWALAERCAYGMGGKA